MQTEDGSRKRLRGPSPEEADVRSAEPPAQRRRPAGLVLAEFRIKLDAVAPPDLGKDWTSQIHASDGGLSLRSRVEKRHGAMYFVAGFDGQEVARAPLRQLLCDQSFGDREINGIAQAVKLSQGPERAFVTVTSTLHADPSAPASAPEERFPGVELVVQWTASDALLGKASVAARSGPRQLGAALRAFRRLLACLYPQELPELLPAQPDAAPSVTPSALLAEAGPRDFPCSVRSDRLAADFTLTLMRYQRQCVAWMLLREGAPEGDGTLEWAAAPAWRTAAVRQDARPLPPRGRGPLPFAPVNVDRSALVWRALDLPAGRRLWVCPATGGALVEGSEDYPEPTPNPASLCPVAGGILADDTGLGKTVQVESCVLLHPWRCSAEEEGELARLRAGRLPAAVPPHSPYAQDAHGKWEAAGVGGGTAVPAFRCVCQPDRWPRPGARADPASYFSCSHCGLQQHVACAGADAGAEGDGRGLAPLCTECLSLLDGIPSGATLIVCTPAILEQWTSELVHHIRPGALRITVYAGVRALAKRARSRAGRGKKRSTPATSAAAGQAEEEEEEEEGEDAALSRIEALLDSAESVGARGLDPRRLAENDIVLTTYATLSRDLNFVDRAPIARAGQTRRGRERPASVFSPLARIRWWRVCLDEAQKTESSSSKAVAMVSRLHAVHRWAVTGTPIKSGVADLQPLFSFLGMYPLSDKTLWRNAIERPILSGVAGPAEHLRSLFRTHAWRNTKASVADQLALPQLAVVRHRVELSGVERSFYEQQARESGRHVLAELDRFAAEQHKGGPHSAGWRQLDPETALPDRVAMRLKLVMQTLRLACCHPQLALQRRSGSAKTSSRVLEIQECLRRLIRDAKVACEEHLRTCAFARNAQAGILMLLARYSDAADCYRGTLRLSDEHARLDRFALLHACHNAAEALDKAGRSPGQAEAGASGERASGRQLRPSAKEVAEQHWEPAALREYTGLLRREVLFQAAARVDAAAAETRRAMTAFRERAAVAGLMNPAWWTGALDLVSAEQARALIDQYRDAVAEDYRKAGTRTDPAAQSLLAALDSMREARDPAGALKRKLVTSTQELAEAYAAAKGTVEELATEPTGQRRAEALDCKVCRPYKEHRGESCFVCRAGATLKRLDAAMYTSTRMNDVKVSRRRMGAETAYEDAEATAARASAEGARGRRDGALEEAEEEAGGGSERRVDNFTFGLLRALAGAVGRLRGSALDPSILEGSKAVKPAISRLDAVYQRMQKLYTAQNQRVSSHIEVDDCVSRVVHRPKPAPGTAPRALRANEVMPGSEQQLLASHAAHADEAAARLRGERGRLRYLQQQQHTEQSQCMICLEQVKQVQAVLPCAHVFCFACVQSMPRRRAAYAHRFPCPTCRQTTRWKQVQRVVASSRPAAAQRRDTAAETAAAAPTVPPSSGDASAAAAGDGAGAAAASATTTPLPAASARSSGSEARGEPDGADSAESEEGAAPAANRDRPASPTGAGFPPCHELRAVSVGDFGSKASAALDVLSEVDRRGEKAVVFSQWESMLDVMYAALRKSELTYFRARGSGRPFSRAVRTFLTHTGPATLLLPLRHGAEGLTLTRASHVLLLEPNLHAAVETQAIGRIQRFVVKRSVEETVELIRDGGEAEVAESRVRKAAAGNELMGLRVRDVLRLVETATKNT